MEGLKEKEHMCPICFDTDPDGMLELDCHHHMHRDCIEGMVRAGWTGKRITFAFISCPECRSPISHPDLKKVLEPHRKLQQKVLQLSLHACLKDGIVDGLKELVKTDKDAALDAAANEISCFICSLCNEPMVGGRKDCADLERMNVSDVVCNSCEWKRPSAYKCTTHGLSEAMIKCDWCCNIATFTCGPGRFCNQCHQPPYAHTQSLFNRKKGGAGVEGRSESSSLRLSCHHNHWFSKARAYGKGRQRVADGGLVENLRRPIRLPAVDVEALQRIATVITNYPQQ